MWINTLTNIAQNDRPSSVNVNGVEFTGDLLTDALLNAIGWVEQPELDLSQGEYVAGAAISNA
jgi:hypothetical protein